MLRPERDESSAALCYVTCRWCNPCGSGELTELDYPQNTLEQILIRAKDRVLSSAEPIVEVTEVLYEAIHDRMRMLSDQTNFSCQYILRMGAVLINGDYDIGSFSSFRLPINH